MTNSTLVQTPYQKRAFLLMGIALVVFVAGFILVFKAAAPSNQAHWPAILWILSEFVALFLFLIGLWQYKKHKQSQPGFVPEE